jgi:hypothetical protein
LLGSALLGSILGGTGCNKFSVQTPQRFVSLERFRTETRYKAVSPDNAVIFIRSFEHKDRGSLAFWVEILKKEMTLRKGYKLEKTESVKTGGGHEGRRLTFTSKSGKTPYTYAVALFVTSSWIHSIETAAKAEVYEAHQQDFDQAISSFRPR